MIELELLPRHQRVLMALNQKTLSKTELRLKEKFNMNTTVEVLNTLTSFGLIEPLKGLRNEGVKLTSKGRDIAAQYALLSVLTDSN